MGFWATAIAGAAGTIIAAIFSWIFGLWPTVWGWVVAGSEVAVRYLTFSVAVPAWLVAIVAIYVASRVVPWLVQVSGRRSERSRTEAAPHADDEPAPPAFSPIELSILDALVAADGKWMYYDDLKYRVREHGLLIEQAVERLMERGLLVDRHNMLHGTALCLSPRGRDLTIEMGLVRGGFIQG